MTSQKFEGLVTDVTKKNELLDLVHPIGSFYISRNGTNPAELFGGTWQPITGRFLYGCDEAHPCGEIGGESDHVLNQAELPRVSGSIGNYCVQYQSNVVGVGCFSIAVSTQGNWYSRATTYIDQPQSSTPRELCDTLNFNIGGDEPHNNMPPYLSVYIFERIA